jgi:hypothetical protein
VVFLKNKFVQHPCTKLGFQIFVLEVGGGFLKGFENFLMPYT